ncbi:MAG: hypothetical protein AABZ47_05085 [Planctomycetota bacterium]
MSMITEIDIPPKPPKVGRIGAGDDCPEQPFRFADLVKAAYPHFVATDISEKRGVARGFVPLGEFVVQAVFSIDWDEAVARLEVRFGVKQERIVEFRRVERSINPRPRLVTAWWDDEDRLAHVRAASAGGDQPKVVRAVAFNFQRTLNAPDIMEFLSSDDAGTGGEA